MRFASRCLSIRQDRRVVPIDSSVNQVLDRLVKDKGRVGSGSVHLVNCVTMSAPLNTVGFGGLLNRGVTDLFPGNNSRIFPVGRRGTFKKVLETRARGGPRTPNPRISGWSGYFRRSPVDQKAIAGLIAHLEWANSHANFNVRLAVRRIAIGGSGSCFRGCHGECLLRACFGAERSTQ